MSFDSKLIFDQHVHAISNKAYQMLGFVFRVTKKFKLVRTYMTSIMPFVRSQLEYASAVWNPFYEIYKGNIESTQRKFTKMLFYRLKFKQQPYHDRLLKLHLPSLEDRRTFLDAMVLRNICISDFDCADLLSLINFRVPRITSRLSHVFSLATCRSNIGQRAPIYRMCYRFNEDFSDLDPFVTKKESYKRELKRQMFSVVGR